MSMSMNLNMANDRCNDSTSAFSTLTGIPGTHTIVPQSKLDQIAKRLINLGKKRDRSVNYLVVEAILEHLEKEENS